MLIASRALHAVSRTVKAAVVTTVPWIFPYVRTAIQYVVPVVRAVALLASAKLLNFLNCAALMRH